MERKSNRSKEDERKFRKTDVVIVGGSLSGLALHQQLERKGIDHLVLEASPINKSPSIHYLTSPAAAETLDIGYLYSTAMSQRQPVTGYTRYNGRSEGLEPLEHLEPNSSRAGFVTLSLQELRSAMGNHPNVLNATPATKFDQEPTGISIGTRDGTEIRTKIVIDATGARANAYQKVAGENSVFRDRTVRACYGGVYPYKGSEDRLLFIDRFPQQTGIPKETAGWIMPLGNGKAEVVVGYETKLGNVGKWHKASVKDLVSEYIKWFNKRGIEINGDQRLEVISGTFSQNLVNYLELPLSSDVALFGESLGLNHPLNGYLIRNIAAHAETMTDEIEQNLLSENWNPHSALVRNSDVSFGPQVVLSRKKQQGSKNGNGRTEATKPVQDMLIDILGEEGLWNAIDDGVDLEQMVSGLLVNFRPQYAVTLLDLAIDYVELLRQESVYRQELRMKIRDRLSSES